MNALAHSALFWIALIFGLLIVYLLPSLIGAARRVEGLGWLVAFNLLSAVAWPAAFLLSVGLPSRRREVPLPASPILEQAQPNWPAPERRKAAAEVLWLLNQADERRRALDKARHA